MDDVLRPVLADPDKLRQVVYQLMENAVKYSPAGALVRLEARARPHGVEITVADEGQGISASHLDRIFDRFYRAGETQPGTGLGLFIAQSLVAAMGGKLWVDSEEGRGSRFSFELPFAVRDDEASLGTSTGPEGAALEPLEAVDTLLRPR